MGLDPMNQSIAKNAADGSFMDKPFARVTQILDKMAKHNQAWHSEDTTGGIAYGSPSLTTMIKENQERDQVIASLATNVNVLTKMFTERQMKKVNIVEDVQPISSEDFEEENYVNNSQGGYQRQQYQGQGQQINGSLTRKDKAANSGEMTKISNPYVPPKGQYSNQVSSSDSKLESMLERVLHNQEKSDTSMRNMTELVGSHTASIQKLEMQMGDLTREQNPKQKGTLPSDTIANPKGSRSGPISHIMPITTRSGKVLQGGSEKVVEVEESEHEVEVEEPSVFEVEKVPEELKVQEENQEEIKERKVDDSKLEKFYDILKQLSVNILFMEVFQEMSGFAKYLKELITKKRTTKNEEMNVTHRVSSIISTSTVQKKEDPGAFTIPCTIGAHDFARALCDNGASINLMPLAIYKQAGLGIPRPISMRLQMADHSMKRPLGIVDDVLVNVVKFHLPADFVILDCAVDKETPITLRRLFLVTGRALMDSEQNEIKLCVNNEEVTFQANKGMKLPHEYESISVIDVVDEVEDAVEMKIEEQCLGEALAAILVNFDGEDMEGYMESVNALEGLGSYTYAPAKLSLDLENRVEQLLDALKKHRQAIGWTIADIRGIPGRICEHKIQMENETKPSVEEHQRRLNPSMKEVVKKEIIKCWMLFGLYNAPDTFQRCMMSIFSDMVEDFLEVFMEDFSVVGNSFEHCLNNHRQVLKRCEETNLVLNWENCNFMVDEGIVLGCFIKDFSKIANPMCKLLEKDAKILFDEKYLKAFEELKQKLTTAPIIVIPDWSLPFELMCDASGVAIGVVLSQCHNKVLHPIYYAIKTLNEVQMNYTVTEQELLAIVYAFEKFRAYLLGSNVIVYIDHVALRYLMEKKDVKPRLIRWVLLLQEFDFEVNDRKGTENQVADHLSRLEEAGRPKEDLEINDAFPDEHILALSNTFAPWYADNANYLVSDLIPNGLESYQKKKFLRDCRQYY
ncbi:uncharacterized protein [Nicotiana sylvestris]|uniref:uncharacterized protein n=1 Tax=Nicotiana sylvestris TaxID=4096 RepID=UPI00388CD9CD